MSHPLDNVLWSALTTSQAHLALGGEQARRFDPRYAGFAAMPQVCAQGLGALARLMHAGELANLAEPVDVEPGPWFDVLARKGLVQMIGAASGDVAEPERLEALGADDAPAMAALVRLTEPGPWAERSPELGRFFGCKADGRLVAMAGERLRVTGHTEISGVCCHPDHRGRGLAADLMRRVSQGIVARGETPFLHALADNAVAIALYERLGMRIRQRLRLTVLRRNDVPAS